MTRTWYLDSENGNDSASGSFPVEAWKTLQRAEQQHLLPGDSLLLKRGCSWQGSFRIRGNGTIGLPITLGNYGAGPRPRLVASEFPILGNDGPVSWWQIKGLELRGAESYDPYARELGPDHGIFLNLDAPSEGMKIEDCIIHDLNGTGIAFHAARQGMTASSGWIVKDCEIYNAGTGIVTQGNWPPEGDLAQVFMCHSNFKVQGCQVHDIATDGIVMHYCQDGVIEHCRAWRTGMGRTKRTPVGIWFFLAARCAIQFCESFGNHTAGGHADGGGFDLDGGCVDCIMQYNYSHDNDGAGYLMCSYDPIKAPCISCVARFNLSVNDGRMNDYASIQLWQVDGCLIHNNTCITRIASCLKFTSATRGHLLANNIFVVDAEEDIPVIQSDFPVNENGFENNLYWRTGGRVSFKLQNNPRVGFSEIAGFFQSRNEQNADPCLSALSGPQVHLLAGSAASHSGKRLEQMGKQDLYGFPPGEKDTVNIGASLRPPAEDPKTSRDKRR